MKIGTLRRLSPEDFPNLPENFISLYNENLESIYLAMAQNLSLADNLNSEERTVKVINGVDKDIELKTLKGNPKNVLHAPELHDFTRLAWSLVRPGTVRVKVDFASAPLDEQSVRFTFVGG